MRGRWEILEDERPQVLPRYLHRSLLLACLAAAAVSSCAQEGYPASLWEAQHEAGAAPSGAGAVAPPGPRICTQTHAQSLAARLVAMSASTAATGTVVLVSDIFQRFVGVCGACHGPAVDPPGNGGFQIQTASQFPASMTAAVLAHVTSDVACPYNPDPTNPKDPMPPCSSPNGMLYSQRSESDPVRQFAELTQAWLAAGSPSSFTLSPGGSARDSGVDGGAGSLALSPAIGETLTNIGNCVPSPGLVAIEATRSAALDAMFAGLASSPTGTAAQVIGLPEHLRDTDLITLDSQALAPYGVIAYAPTYPLWSDNAGKLRYVRVPRGTSIRFDKATQHFQIPPNTRFYKTFLKQIVDTDGSLRWRKMETRLILARPDKTNADGTSTPTALFGSYKWSDDESDAVLVQTPLNSGKPFADTLFLYDIDEPLAATVLHGNPAAPEEALLEARAARHYAIPSSQRCIQCHMGSPNEDFVLGFLPLQVARRAAGVGGVIEPAGADELTQLQRFIDYGLVTGIASPADLVPLERSEGTRAPRSDYELVAQGYMLGNCAHCHNPRGFPTIQNPVLRDVLDFLPAPTSGIFQFPLERYSPRFGRGQTGSTPIPYITPSLMDLPRSQPGTGNLAQDIFTQGSPDNLLSVIYAPWRSLIYRNVDAAFAYTDDLALYPHMPMNTAGYDPRAKQIMSDWMVSIPAIRKHPEIPEYAFFDGAEFVGGAADASPQPYVELAPGAPGYTDAQAAAKKRLDVLHTGVNPALPLIASGAPYSRYDAQGDTTDILDPAVVVNPICHPIPARVQGSFYPFAQHPHWVFTDLTQPPGPWSPRQPNWPAVVVEQQVAPSAGGCTSTAGAQAAYEDQRKAVALLQSATLDQVRDFATTPVPFGLWQVKSGCDFSTAPTVSSFTGASRPHWMDVVQATPSAPVFSQTPGAAVFKMICINCHGPNADSNGRMAQNLATMTGGLAEVADFRDGLFGPVGAAEPASNRHRVFGVANLPSGASPSWLGVTDDDRAARYMAWMALGGTPVHIPIDILEIIAITHVLDQQRVLEASQLSANMLSQAKALCLSVLGPDLYPKAAPTFNPTAGHGYLDLNLNKPLIGSNGDAELWLRMCTIANPPPVHLLEVANDGSFALDKVPATFDEGFNLTIPPGKFVAGPTYPPGTPIGNERGEVDASLLPTNEWPWCVDVSRATTAQVGWVSGSSLPVCPASLTSAAHACALGATTGACFGNDDANVWAVRGAVNAGFSVFLYVQALESGGAPPDFNQCELRK